MANEEHLKILKQGVEVWNKWRQENPEIVFPDLGGANLRRANLGRANLRGANLRGADLIGTHLIDADLRGADFGGADLGGAELAMAHLSEADLSNANLSEARIGLTKFVNLDLSKVKGLETVRHGGPSTIGIDTIYRSGGKIPEAFLRGCGLSDWEIGSAKLYRPGLSHEQIGDIVYRIHDLRVHQAIQISSLFISYSHSDGAFVDHLEGRLNKKGVRFWRDVHHATAGPLEKQVDRAIRLNPTVLLILSIHSVKSDWVEHEARKARELEKEMDRHVLCPVALDDSWKRCRWPERLREQIEEYNILDFSKWEDKAFFQRQFTKLIDGLDLFYKGETAKAEAG